MKNFRVDGLYMKDRIYAEDGKNQTQSFAFYLWDYLMLLLGSWAILLALVGALSMVIPKKEMFILLLIYSFIVFLLFSFPKYLILKLVFLLGTLLGLGYHYLPRIINGFFLMENLVIDRIKEYYHYQYLYYMADHTDELGDLGILFTFIMAILITILILGMRNEMMKSITTLCLSLPMILNFALGRVPSAINVILFLIVSIYLNKKQKNNLNKMSRVHQKVGLILCLLVLLLCGLIRALLPPNTFDKIEYLADLKSKIEAPFYEITWEEFIEKLENSISPFSGEKAVGGLDGGKLANVEEVIYNNSVQLTLSAPYTSILEGIYLKGYVGSVYTGSSWDEHNEKDRKRYAELIKESGWVDFNPLNQIPDLLQEREEIIKTNEDYLPTWDIAYQGQLSITYQDANKRFLYVPYFTDLSNDRNMKSVMDLYVEPKKQQGEYQWNYFFNLDYNTPIYRATETEPIDQQEKMYREFVYSVYTQVPEEGLEQLKGDFATVPVKYSFKNYMEYVNYVVNFLHKNTSYSLNPGKLPNGKDYVEYFLYENKIGYCAHYATAATLMFRIMGIPARYVEGYAVDSSVSINESNINNIINDGISLYPYDLTRIKRKVLDSDAHAWVEIYVDGLGWMPLDVTPGSSHELDQEVLDMLGEEKREVVSQVEKPTVTPTPTPTPTIKPTKTTTPTPLTSPSPTPLVNDKAGVAAKEDVTEKYDKGIKVLGISIITLGILLIGWKVYRWKKRRALVTNGQKSLYYYNQIELMLRLCGGIPRGEMYLEGNQEYVYHNINYIILHDLDTAVELAREARFQKEDTREENLDTMKVIHGNIRKGVVSNETLIKRGWIILRLLF